MQEGRSIIRWPRWAPHAGPHTVEKKFTSQGKTTMEQNRCKKERTARETL